MVLEIKPTAEDIETAVLSPSRRIGEPTRQLFDENSLAQFAQDVRNVLVKYYTPGSGKLSGPEAVPATSMCGWSDQPRCSQSRKVCLGLTTMADRSRVATISSTFARRGVPSGGEFLSLYRESLGELQQSGPEVWRCPVR
jgi:hypothetical protein